jgi:hypothetical protein
MNKSKFSKYSKAELEAYDRKLQNYQSCNRCEGIRRNVINGLCPDCQRRVAQENAPLKFGFNELRDPRLIY